MSSKIMTLAVGIAVATAINVLGPTKVWAQGQGGGGPSFEATELDCENPCVDESELTFDPATQDELDAVIGGILPPQCGLGETAVSDGEGGFICFPAGPIWHDRFAEESDCPCDFLNAVTSPHQWIEDAPLVCAAIPTTINLADGRFSLRDDSELAPLGTLDSIQVTQFGSLDLFPMSCLVVRNGSIGVPMDVLSVDERDDCFEDLRVVALALGTSCPEPPNFIELP